MSGIYIHIPFCKQACHYCNFHFSTSLRYKNELIAALLGEISLTKDFFPEAVKNAGAVETIYFGGGTPSLCTKEEIDAILSQISASFEVAAGAEITLEANPDDITEERLLQWKDSGITRLSIGIQSFFEEDLVWMNRAHNSSQAWNSLQLATKYFDNITIDLIYGTPGLTDDKWKQNVDRVISLGIPHISCYALTVEPKTPLQKMIREHKLADVDPDHQSAQFLLLMTWLADAGFEHYEISNFAKPGFRSRHNSSYWKGKPYFGFGPSAHSFDGESRWWNIANNTTYIRSIEQGAIPYEKEVLTPVQQVNEMIMISLRTLEGLDTSRLIQQIKGIAQDEILRMKQTILEESARYISNGLMVREGDWLRLTYEGKLLADGIAADLFFD
ncbi:radical SAM family heme chaperone HemW [Terrimonas sp. NA20]|uniref:Heme chaperone HemW n=1 Tax=Terrimonas ginsenosidimutans TaxID=2908004 RepID=A0ABS9KPA8_9BACT|nr:radical SAM family heme chaperone HemW [Terrimonas ginsenosidimutans]MCG2614144.1 radical SAM family heme chaperone HemW [Terrimonas ginsenosidimutans]